MSVWRTNAVVVVKMYKQTMYQKKQKAKICTKTIQNGVTKKCSIYHKYKKK